MIGFKRYSIKKRTTNRPDESRSGWDRIGVSDTFVGSLIALLIVVVLLVITYFFY